MTVNALSPIANTRMVVAAVERARQEGRAGGGGGLTLDSMPGPEQLGPLGAHLVGDGFGWCTGQVVFASGPEVAIVDQPRLMEVVRTTGASLRCALGRGVCSTGPRQGRGQAGERRGRQSPLRFDLRRAGTGPGARTDDEVLRVVVVDRARVR